MWDEYYSFPVIKQLLLARNKRGDKKNQTNWRDILTATQNKDCTYKLAGVLELSYPTDIQMAFSLLQTFWLKVGMLGEILEHLTAN